MANTQKITKAQKFAMLKAIPAVAENAMLVEFIEHEMELLAKKNSAEKKPTAQQTANDSIKVAIVGYMVEGVKYTISDLIKTHAELVECSNQKISALLTQLLKANLVVRSEVKGKAYYALPSVETEEKTE